MSFEQLNVLVPAPDCETLDGPVTVVPGSWRDGRAEPTQATIDAVTQAQIDNQELLAFRERAKQAPDNVESHLGITARALIDLLNKRDNFLANRIIQLQDTLIALQASSGTPASRLNGLPTNYAPTATRPRADAVQDYKDNIDTGNADT